MTTCICINTYIQKSCVRCANDPLAPRCVSEIFIYIYTAYIYLIYILIHIYKHTYTEIMRALRERSPGTSVCVGDIHIYTPQIYTSYIYT